MKQVKITYQELLDSLTKLTPEQRQMPVIWLGDERGGFIGGVEVLKEGFVNFGEGLEPWRLYEGGEYKKEEAITFYPTGTVFLLTDVPG